LIQERGTAEWVDAYGRPVGLEGPDSDRNLLQMRPIYDPEAAALGAEPSLGLYMEAKDTFQPNDIITISSPQWDAGGRPYGNPAIYKLKRDKQVLDISYLGFNVIAMMDLEPAPSAWNIYIENYAMYKYDFMNHDTSVLINEENGRIPSFNWGDKNQIELARIQLKELQLENIYYDGVPPYYQENELVLPILSYNENFIGGFLWRIGNLVVQKSIGLWDAGVGNEIKRVYYTDEYPMEAPGEIEIRFSQSDQFIVGRYADYVEPNDKIEQHHYEHLCYLLNTNTLELWPAHGDVAFTSDERWLVTGREGMPTLVDAVTGADLQRYDIGETNIMTAACFSPDDRQLYIAGIDQKIYFFDSHLPSRAAGWEVYP